LFLGSLLRLSAQEGQKHNHFKLHNTQSPLFVRTKVAPM